MTLRSLQFVKSNNLRMLKFPISTGSSLILECAKLKTSRCMSSLPIIDISPTSHYSNRSIWRLTET